MAEICGHSLGDYHWVVIDMKSNFSADNELLWLKGYLKLLPINLEKVF